MQIRQFDFHKFNPSEISPLKSGELHVWLVSADHADLLREASHKALRRLLSAYTGIPENNLSFGKNAHGKPYLLSVPLSDEPAPALHFNLSHSGQYAALAFSSCTPVGIDIENINRRAGNMEEIARRVFLPAEAADVRQHSGMEQKQLFFRCWTRTESFLKGLGTGLSVMLADKKVQKEYSFWTVQEISVPDGYLCSVAYRRL